MRLVAGGVTVELPSGWEGSIEPGGETVGGAVRPTVAHLANYPLPAARGDYGDGAVDAMKPGEALVVLLEFVGASVTLPLFQSVGLPLPLRNSDFDRNALQRRIEGQGGCQRFFQSGGRAFCLYVVVGSYFDRADVIPAINELLATVAIT